MAGFTWPLHVSGSSPSYTTIPPSSVLVSSLAMTHTVSVTGIPLSISPSAVVSATSGSGTSSASTVFPTSAGLQRTTRVRVTHTVTVIPTVTASMTVAPFGVSMSEYNEETLFSMSQPLATSAPTDNLLLSTPVPSQHDTRGSSSSIGATLGATVAVVGGIIFLFLLYKYCKRSKPRSSSDVELGHVSSTRSRQHQGLSRSVPISDAYGVDAVALANAQNWQDGKGLQGYAYEPRGTARPAGKRSSSNCISPSALAQAQGWDRPFGTDGFQVSRTYGGDVGPSVQLSTHVPLRKPVPAARPVGKQRRDTQQTGRNISPISPQTEDEARHHGPSDYCHVSPLA